MRDYEDVSFDFDVEAVRDVLSEVPVTLAVLYGSRARGQTSETSDFDVAVQFEESLTSLERTRARLALIERLSRTLATDRIDVVPLERAQETLRREIQEDGVVIYGSPDRFETVRPPSRGDDDRLADFDELLSKLERVV